MKRVAMIVAAAALALTPGAAAAKKPVKSPERAAAKAERKQSKGSSARTRCRRERAELGVAAFAAKYGKARTKGGAKAKAKAARAAFGRCVSQAAKAIRAEREADEEAAELEGLEDDGAGLGDELSDDAPEEHGQPEPDDGDATIDDQPEDTGGAGEDDDEPAGLGGEPDLG